MRHSTTLQSPWRLLAAALRGSFGAHRHDRVRIVAIYWHFVDTVWVGILFTIYLSTRL